MGIEVQMTEACYPEDLQITIYFGEPLDEEAQTELTGIFNAWYTLGKYGAFDGFINTEPQIWFEEDTMGLMVDMGSAGQATLDTITLLMEGFMDRYEIEVTKIVYGMENLIA